MNGSESSDFVIPQPDRPDFPKGYGISKKPKGMLTWEWVDERMTRSRNYWICSTRPDGRPHAAPVWGIWFDRRLYFGSDPAAQKAVNLRHRADVVVHLESGDEVVIMEGTATISSDKDLIERVVQANSTKYGMPLGDDPGAPLMVFTPHKVLAWTEADFGNTATRWQFEA